MLSGAQVRDQLRRQGFAVVHDFLSSSELEALLKECELLVQAAEAYDTSRAEIGPEWAAITRGCIFETVGGQHDGAAAFRELRRRCLPQGASAPAADLLFGPAMQRLVHAALGTSGYLFNDQYIVKPPRSPLSAFRWHRDCDWMCGVDMESHPYISVWCALHDMVSGNGALRVRAPPGASSDGAAEVLLEVPAGTAVVMADNLPHCSAPNLSASERVAWMPQFSAAPIRYRSTGQPVSLAIPMLGEAEGHATHVLQMLSEHVGGTQNK